MNDQKLIEAAETVHAYLRRQLADLERSMRQVAPNLFDWEDDVLIRTVHCQDCGTAMHKAGELCTIAGVFVCRKCLHDWLIAVDGVDPYDYEEDE